jgi:hypothetical protein
MTAAPSFAVDDRKVVHETIDGETILIHLESGTYYSLQGAGSEMWALLASGTSLQRAATVLRDRHPEDADRAEEDLGRLAAELVGEGLLAQAAPEFGGAEPPDLGPPAPFEPPALQRYTDMQYFLLLDPVHEVDASAGWPEPAAEQPAA